MIRANYRQTIAKLRKDYLHLKSGKESLLALLEEAELPELVYNSNAIENSTLTLKETEKILQEQEVMRDISVRELFEAKNLARVSEYLRSKPNYELSIESILLLHQMLISGIDDSIAGRLRSQNEYVRVGSHVAPDPEQLQRLLENLLLEYRVDLDTYFLEKISRFHLEFERIHPFCDGNGRIGRLLINIQLAQLGLPSVIIRNKGKQKEYYPAFSEYTDRKQTSTFDSLMTVALLESLHKCTAYLRGLGLVDLATYAKSHDGSVGTLRNAAKRQTIPAFREKGTWRIGIET